MGAFSGMGKVRSTQGGNYIRPGNYLHRINRCKEQKNDDTNKTHFIAELTVMESKQTDDDVKPNAVGEDVSVVIEVPGEWPKLSFGNIKALLKAGFGSVAEANGDEGPTDDEIDEEMTDHAVSEENPLAGVFVRAKAFNKPTKKGNDFTRVNWSVPGNLEELAESAESA